MFNINGFWFLIFGIAILAITSFSSAYAEHKELSKPTRFFLGLIWFGSVAVMTLLFGYVYSIN